MEQIYPDPQFNREDIGKDLPNHCLRAIEMQAQILCLHRPCYNPPWTSAEISTLQHMYVNPQFNREDILQALPSHSWEAIAIQARRHKFQRPDLNPYQIRRHYFAEINTPYKAYDLGLIAADGTILDDGCIRLWLQKRDKSLVRQVRDRIAPGAPIYERRNACGFQICSREMTTDLQQIGITPRKSLTLEWPHKLPNQFVTSFLLGYFDGDGSLTQYTTRGNTYWAWSILGTCSFLSIAHCHIQNHTGVIIREPYPADKRSPYLYIIRAGGQKAVTIDRMLNASGLGLPRKHLPHVS